MRALRRRGAGRCASGCASGRTSGCAERGSECGRCGRVEADRHETSVHALRAGRQRRFGVAGKQHAGHAFGVTFQQRAHLPRAVEQVAASGVTLLCHYHQGPLAGGQDAGWHGLCRGHQFPVIDAALRAGTEAVKQGRNEHGAEEQTRQEDQHAA